MGRPLRHAMREGIARCVPRFAAEERKTLTPPLWPTLMVLATCLAACQPAPPKPTPAQIAAHAGAMRPADPRLADLYAHACKACHAASGSGAPLAGDRDAWAPRAAKGMSGLLTSVVSGYRGMPAGGQCFSCTGADYQALIRFMAAQPVH